MSSTVKSQTSLHVNGDTREIDVVSDSTDTKEYIQHIIDSPNNTDDDSFCTMNIGELQRVYEEWKKALPRVHPFYAMKCNDDPVILKVLATLGTGFDCASMYELEAVLDIGVNPDKIIYANPCKQISHLKYAAEKGVKLQTFDSVEELNKIKQFFPSARLMLRLRVDDVTAELPLGDKFGCSVQVGKKLLNKSISMGLEVVGVCFHIGSGSHNPSIYRDGIETCSQMFEYAATIGYKFHILDVGGGFSDGNSPDLFSIQAKYINEGLDRYFNEKTYSDLEIMAEPGQYMCNTALTVVTNIISVKTIEEDETNLRMYYLNDGFYGSFSLVVLEGVKYPPSIFKEKSPTFKSILWGPTLDPTDKICEIDLPKLNVGDWIYFEHMGAYSVTLSTTFNKFLPPKRYYYVHSSEWKKQIFEA